MVFLIKISAGYLVYIAIWVDPFFAFVVGVDGNNSDSKHRVFFWFWAPLAAILAAVTLIFVFLFPGLISRFIDASLKSGWFTLLWVQNQDSSVLRSFSKRVLAVTIYIACLPWQQCCSMSQLAKSSILALALALLVFRIGKF